MIFKGRPLHAQLSSSGYLTGTTRRIVREQSSTIRWLQILLNLITVVTLLVLLSWLRLGNVPPLYQVLAVITILLMAIVYEANGVYMTSVTIRENMRRLARAWAIVIVSLVLIGFITKTSALYSREVILTWATTAFLGQCLMIFFVARLRARTRSIPTLMLGAGNLARHITEHINRDEWLAERVVGVLSNHDENRQRWDIENVPVLGMIEDVEEVIARLEIRRLYIAVPLEQAQSLREMYTNLARSGVDVIWAPDIFGIDLINHSVREIAGAPIIALSESPLTGTNAFTKTLLDYAGATAALVALSPLMMVVALLIKMTSRGPILFVQKRHGWDGRIIDVYKFRSMRVHEEDEGHVTQATKNDKRVTPIGRFIRRTSIDELPQLFNVLNGTMSLVGPRPHPLPHNKHYSDKIRAYMLRHRVKPGITGLAQVNGFRGETPTVGAMEQRVEFDLAYINNWSISLDIKILFRTVFVLFGDNVY